MIPKSGGGVRLCIDYRRLNKVTTPDLFPIPLVEDLIDRLGQAKVISVLDLAKGYIIKCLFIQILWIRQHLLLPLENIVSLLCLWIDMSPSHSSNINKHSVSWKGGSFFCLY